MQKNLKCRKFGFVFDLLLHFSGILYDVVKRLSTCWMWKKLKIWVLRELAEVLSEPLLSLNSILGKMPLWKGLSSIGKATQQSG